MPQKQRKKEIKRSCFFIYLYTFLKCINQAVVNPYYKLLSKSKKGTICVFSEPHFGQLPSKLNALGMGVEELKVTNLASSRT